jgi:hypothetical protein
MSSSIYDLFVRAMIEEKQVACVLDGHPRVFSVIILGHRTGEEVALVWQTGGSSSRGLPPGGAWRAIKLSNVRDPTLQEGKLQSGDSHKTEQNWVTEVDLDVNPRSPYRPRRRLNDLRH